MQRTILVIGNFLSRAGRTPGVCEELASALRENGWEVHTASPAINRALRLLDMVTIIYRTRRKVRVAQIDLFSGSAFMWAETASFLLHHLRKPYVLTLHGGNLPAFGRRWPGRMTRVLSKAALITAPSAYLQETMSEYRADIHFLPNPVDLGRCKFRVRSAIHPRLIWLRAFHSLYNPALAPLVLARVARSYPEASLTMVGPDKGDGSLQQTRETAAAAGVEKQVEFVGAVSKADVPAWLARGDIFLNTTNADNAPVSVLEAMACGLCVVSTDVGGIPHLLEHEVDALLVPPGDADAMAEAVGRILSESGLAERLSRNARAKAELHDWSVVLPQWENLLLSLANGDCR